MPQDEEERLLAELEAEFDKVSYVLHQAAGASAE